MVAGEWIVVDGMTSPIALPQIGLNEGKSMAKRHIDLRSKTNPGCERCSRQERKRTQNNDLCTKALSVEDGMPVRCVGKWAYEKVYRLVQYFGIFTRGMRNKWDGKLNYIEICSGPGRCVFRESGEEVDGTSLAIARHPSFSILSKALFIDYDDTVVDILKKRLHGVTGEANGKVQALKGDFNDQSQLRGILDGLPDGHLNLAFIDPTECNVPFETITLIAEALPFVDLIVNVAVGTDANRNLVRAFLEPSFEKARDKYSGFLGSEAFFQEQRNIEFARTGNNQALRQEFVSEYLNALGQLGFIHTDARTVKTYYHLLFASRNAKGLEFWEKANNIEPDGQRTLGL